MIVDEVRKIFDKVSIVEILKWFYYCWDCYWDGYCWDYWYCWDCYWDCCCWDYWYCYDCWWKWWWIVIVAGVSRSWWDFDLRFGSSGVIWWWWGSISMMVRTDVFFIFTFFFPPFPRFERSNLIFENDFLLFLLIFSRKAESKNKNKSDEMRRILSFNTNLMQNEMIITMHGIN